MKSLIKKTSSSLALALLFVNQAFAQGTGFWSNPKGGSAQPGATASGDLGTNISTMINYFLGILGLVAVGFLIYAGILMVTAGGNEEQVGKARKLIMYAIAGIVIILLSYTIVQFVTAALG